MRIVGLLLVVALLLVGACTATTSPDEDCITQGGICFIEDMSACDVPITTGQCSTGYMCCTSVDPYNVKNGKVIDGGAPPVFDTGVDATGVDATDAATTDAGHDATAADATMADATDAKTAG